VAYPPDAYQAILTKAGARQNAYTTDDFTNYHTRSPRRTSRRSSRSRPTASRTSSTREEAFKTEARAVLGEYNKNSANPISKLFEAQREQAPSRAHLPHTTMGFLADIEDMPNQFEYSRPSSTAGTGRSTRRVIVAGDVDPATGLPAGREVLGRLEARQLHAPRSRSSRRRRGRSRARDPGTPTLPWVSVAFHGPAFSDDRTKEWAALDILSDLTFGPTSELYSAGGRRAEGRPALRLLPGNATRAC
jgi:zinc protease